MAISLSQLRIEATMDAAGYVAGGNAKVATDQKMVASGNQLAGSIDQTQRRLGASGSSFERLARQIDPAYAAQQKFEAGARTLQRSLDAGNLTQQRHAELLNLLVERYGQVQPAAGAAATSTGQVRFAVQNLGFQLNDIATSLASGGSPFRVLAQQGGQVVQAFQQGGGISAVIGGLTTSIRNMITPTTAAVAGIGALAVGVGLLALRSNTSTQAIREFNVLLQGMSVQSLATAQGLESAAKSMLDVGLNAAEARKQLTDVTRAGLNPAAAPQIVRTGANLTAYLGGDQTAALTQALAGGVDAAAKYAVQVGALTGAQAALRQEMARTTPGAKVLDDILQQIAKHSEGLYQQGLSPLGKSFNELKIAFDQFFESLSKSGEVQGFIKGVKDTISELDHLARVLGMVKDFVSGAPVDRATAAIPPAPAAAAGGGTTGVAGGAPGYAIVSEAQSMVGLNENRDRATIAAYLASGGAALDPATTAWCAAFANAVLARQGITGTGSNIATSFLNWGAGVSGDVAAGDIIVLPRGRGTGQTGGHVGFATGSTSLTEQGLMLEMISGNRGNAVTQDWVNANEATLRRSTQQATGAGAGAAAGVAGAGTAQSEEAIRLARSYADAQQRAAEATRGVGLANEFAKIQAEVAGRTDLDANERARLATDLRAAAVTRLTNEIANENNATKLELSGAESIARAYAESSAAGKIEEAVVRGQTQALQKYGETGSNASQQYAAGIAKQQIALEKFNETTQNAKDLLAGKDTQAQLQLQISLTGQLPEIAQRELTLLQAKQQITKDFPFLTQQEKDNRLAMVQATADLNVKLAETQRAQQQIDSIFSSIGNTIQTSIGNVIDGIFDPKKAVNFGKALTDIFKSLGSTLIQGLLIKPLTGTILGALGASPSVTSQFGSLGNLFSGIGLAKDVAGLGGSSSGGGLFSGINSWIDTNIGSSLGFSSGALDFGGGGELGVAAGTGELTSGSLFGATTLSSVLPFLGIGAGLLGMILPSLFKRKPSNASAGANFDLSNFKLTAGFAGGNSQVDQQTQQVAQGVQKFLDLLKTTGGALTGNVLLQNGVNTGFTADSSLPGYSGRFNLGKDPAGALNMIELALARSLTGISDTMKTVIDQVGDPAAIEGAIAFVNAYDNLKTAADDAFKSIEDATKQTGPFAQAMDQINATFQDLTAKANQFGLSLDPINAGLAEATRRLQGDFGDALDKAFNEATGKGFINQLNAASDTYQANLREAQHIGLTDQATADRIGQLFGAQVNSVLSGLTTDQINQAIAAFSGLDDYIANLARSAEAAGTSISDMAAAQDQAAQAAAQIKDYVTSLQATPSAFVSPLSALTASKSAYRDMLTKAQGGDVTALSGLTGSADALIKNITGYYGSSAAGVGLVQNIEQELSAVSAAFTPNMVDPVVSAIGGSTAATQALAASNDNWLQSINTHTSDLYDVAVAVGDVAKAQRDQLISLVQQMLDALRLQAAA